MAKKTILIVEDEIDILELVDFHLQQEGFKTVTVKSGDKALKLIKKSPPDLVVLDIMLPGMIGTEVCKILKQSDETSHIPILILTAKGEEIDRVVGFELGADESRQTHQSGRLAEVWMGWNATPGAWPHGRRPDGVS